MTSETTLRERKEIDAVVEGKTLVDIFRRNAERYPDQPAIHWKDGSVWKHLTWSQYRTRVSEAAAGLLSLGFGADDYVAIMAGNRPEHATADLAAIHAGGTGVTIYSTLTAEQIQYVAQNCEAKVAVVEDPVFMKRWEEIKPQLPNLQYVVLLEGADNYATSDWVLSWDDVARAGPGRPRRPATDDRGGHGVDHARDHGHPHLHLRHHRHPQGCHDHPPERVVDG
jgi:long-chain acyl-CoA synthetase